MYMVLVIFIYVLDIIENRDVLMTIIVMLKFTQSLRPTLHEY